MSGPASRLPARPSIEQLKKQAKERLVDCRVEDPDARLADAQHALASDYGFGSWPHLVRHVESVRSADRIGAFERLAEDLLAGYHGDTEALRRLIAHYGVSYGTEQLRVRVRGRVDDARGGAPTKPRLDDVRTMVAREYGFASWDQLEVGLAQAPVESPPPPVGRSTTPPFYHFDETSNTIEPVPPLSDAGWEALFEIMAERGITGIRTPAITDRAMASLARLDHVTRIDFDGAQVLTDDGVRYLADMPQITELDLSGRHGLITDAGLEVLSSLAALRTFSMSWAQRVTDEGLVHLGACEHLERLSLMGTPTGDRVLRALRGKPRLTDLWTGTRVTDEGLAYLHDIPEFAAGQGDEIELDLMSFGLSSRSVSIDGPFTDRGLASLAGLDGLRALNLFSHAHEFTGSGLSALRALPNLVYLGCQGRRCDDAAMESIGTLPELRMLMAQGSVATDRGFAALGQSQSIEYIWGRECPNLTGAGFAALANLPRLEGLGVSCKRVEDAELSLLPSFPSLRQLMPMDVDDAGFRHIGACSRLEDLICMYCRDTGDTATEHVADLRLKSYYAGRTRITDRSLELLGRMKTLETIELSRIARVTDAGLAALAGLPRLREITVVGSPGTTPSGFEGLAESVRVRYEP